MKTELIISCEHASNKIPQKFIAQYKKSRAFLQTHKGYDIGAKSIYRAFVKLLPYHAQHAQYSRLLIDLNRTLNHSNIFSPISQCLDNNSKTFIIDNYYLPYVSQLKNKAQQVIKKHKTVLHISVHSFTPKLNNQPRLTDIGLLYDPQCALEKKLCRLWQQQLKLQSPELRVRMNYPYRGTSNGLTTYFRNFFPKNQYIGIELEINQNLFKDSKNLHQLQHLLIQSFKLAQSLLEKNF